MSSEVTAMQVEDLLQVVSIEEQSHPKPWTEAMFREELTRQWARLVVVRDLEASDKPVVAFSNYWLVHDEVHLLNIATARKARRKGYGRQLIEHILVVATEHNCRSVILEVRKSNRAAQNLYLAHGFESVGLRPRYYADNKEDALIMLLEVSD